MIVTKNRISLEGVKRYCWGMSMLVKAVVSMSSFIVYIVVYTIIKSVRFRHASIRTVFLMIAAVFTVYCIFQLIKVCLSPYRFYANLQKTVPNLTETISFSENGFSVYCVCDSYPDWQTDYSYNRVTRAFGKGEWLVIYTDEEIGYSIHNSSFVQGSPQELMDLLAYKLGDRFRIRRK